MKVDNRLRWVKHLRRAVLRGKRNKLLLAVAPRLKRLLHIAAHFARTVSGSLYRLVVMQPHYYLVKRVTWYRRWHSHKYHTSVHVGFTALGTVCVLFIALGIYKNAYALPDLSDFWNFSSPAAYTIDSGIETSGSSARLKAQGYTSDSNTRALYHLDDAAGTNVSDSSSHNNAGTVGGTSSWVTGNLNGGLSLNGGLTNIHTPDSASLSLSQGNTLEGWTKFATSFGPATHDHKQSIIDKGAYQLYYDQETGKATYELADSSATTWSQQAGNDIKGSWDVNGKFAVQSQVAIGSDVYAGLGNAIGDAEVWKWDGTVWVQVGGDGKNGSWANQTYESVTSIAASGTTLYAGLGSTTGDAEVWSCDTASDCATWTKIGGDGINSGWAVNTFEEVDSMSVMGGNLYVGLGNTANDARVYRWNGSAWTWVGGFGISAPYNAFATGYEGVYGMANDGTSLYVSFGSTAGDGDVWRLTGTTWTQIGGDAVNSSWAAATFEYAYSLRWVGSTLYAGLGATAGDAEVWSWNGTAWTKIGGDTVNTSWDSSSYEVVYSLADDGTNIYAGLGNTAGDNEVWRYNGTTWTKIGGDAINSGFTNTHTHVNSMVYAGSTLYAGLTSATSNAEIWSWNGSAWTRMGGGYVNKSWGFLNLQDVESMAVSGDYLYAGTGNATAGNAQVWRFDGSTWQIVGGQGVNGSWPVNTYEAVMSMTSMGGNLYAGLGTGAGDGEVWRFNGTTWTQIGGDSLNSGWTTNYDEVYSLVSMGGSVYAGLGNTATEAEVWKWNGSVWSKVGGDGLNSSWNTTYERVSSMAVYGGVLYAGIGNTVTDAEVWRFNGTNAWTKIGGDGVSSSWNTNYEQIESLIAYNGKLYAGLGNSTGDAEVWEYNGSTWVQSGGDSLNGSWLDGQYEQAKSLSVYNGRLYAGLGNSAGDGEVWELDGSTWSRVGGSGTNSSWAVNTIETVRSLGVYKGKLYAGLGDTANADTAIWSYGDNGFLQSAATTQDTNWHHIAATYDGATMKLYIDGVLNNSTSATLSMPDTSQALLTGASYGAGNRDGGQGYFDGSLDEIRISDIARSSFTTQPYSSSPQAITLTDAVRKTGVWHWDSLDSNETANGGTVTYRLSDDDGTTWKYWNGAAWVASGGLTEANAQAVIDANIATFPVTFNGITWQAILDGDGTQRVTLNSITLESTSDTAEPDTTGMSITALKAAGSSSLASNAWTNGSSPYFSWNPASDAASGVKGYCAYLGADNTADPITTKGLLGTSPGQTGSACQFVVPATNLDLASPGILGTPLATSNAPYYLTLKAIDNAGNVSLGTVQFHFRFDNTTPTNPGFITAPSGFVNNKTIALSWPTSGGNAPADTNSGLAGLQYRIGSSGTWYGDSHTGTGDVNDILANDGSYITQDPPDFDNLEEGVNTIYFRTWDQAGNVTNSYVTAELKINTSGAPSVPQNVIATPSTNTTNSFAFSWAAPATFIGSASNITYCYTINTLPSASTCTFTGAGVTSLGAGAYATQPGTNTLYVVARDESSNINYSSYGSANFTANTSAPGIPLNLDIVDVSIKSTSNWRLALTWDAPSNVGSGVSAYKILRSTDNVTFTQVGSSSSTTYIDAGLSQQRYYYQVKACDSTNNCGAISTTVNALPTGKFTSPAALVAQPSVTNITTKGATIVWSTDRASDSKVALGTASGAYGSSEIGNSNQVTAHQINLDNLSPGTTYYFVTKWTDGDGNTGTSQEFSFTTSPPPSLKEIATLSIGLSDGKIQFTSRNAEKVSVLYGKSESFGGVETINTSTNESTYTVNLDNLEDGAKYFYKLIAYDAEGNSYEGSTFSFTTLARPRITNVRFQPVPGEPTSTQMVTWQTNVPATSVITYGKAGSSGSDASDSKLILDHQMIIRNLEDDSEYFLVAQSRDGSGNVAVSDRQVFRTALDTRPPKVSDVTVESSIRGTGAEARGQIVVSWHTDEPASSQVNYTEGSSATNFNSRTAEDTSLSLEHIVIISDLPTSRVYSVQPVSRDKAGNAETSTVEPAIIGRSSDNVLTIILNSLRKVFGF